MDILETILNLYGISLYDESGKERTFIEVLDEIYLKLDRFSLLQFMDQVEQNSLEIFNGGNTNEN